MGLFLLNGTISHCSCFPATPLSTATSPAAPDTHALRSGCLKTFQIQGLTQRTVELHQGIEILALETIRKWDKKDQNMEWSQCPNPSHIMTHSCLEEDLCKSGSEIHHDVTEHSCCYDEVQSNVRPLPPGKCLWQEPKMLNALTPWI